MNDEFEHIREELTEIDVEDVQSGDYALVDRDVYEVEDVTNVSVRTPERNFALAAAHVDYYAAKSNHPDLYDDADDGFDPDEVKREGFAANGAETDDDADEDEDETADYYVVVETKGTAAVLGPESELYVFETLDAAEDEFPDGELHEEIPQGSLVDFPIIFAADDGGSA